MAKSIKQARKPAAKKTASKKAAAKKTAAKRPIAKKTTSRKVVPKKPVEKKAGVKKSPARKPKPVPKKKAAPFNRLQQALGWPSTRALLDRAVGDDASLRIIVEAARGVAPAALRAHLHRVYGTVSVERLFPIYDAGADIPSLQDFHVVTLTGLRADALAANPFDIAYASLMKGVVAGAEPDISLMSVFDCSDPTARPHNDRRWALKQIRAKEAWDIMAAAGKDLGGGIKIGHPDTGFTFHARMANKFDIANGRDFIRNIPGGMDPLPDAGRIGEETGHGTKTASIIVGRDPDPAQIGVTGIAPDATIMPLRVTRSVALGMPSRLAKAVYWAQRHGCDILSISLGGVTGAGVYCAIRNAYAHDMLICCAAGQCIPQVLFPAVYNESIACGGSRLRFVDGQSIESYWTPSARGPIDIAAPAEVVWRCGPGVNSDEPLAAGTAADPFTATGNGEGTSFAAPAVAAVGALWLKFHEDKNLRRRYIGAMSLNRVFRRILGDTARQPPGWEAWHWGRGILDAAAVLREPLPPGGLRVPMAEFLANIDQISHMAQWTRMFSGLPPNNVGNVLARMLGAANPTELEAKLKQFGLELAYLMAGAPARFAALRRAIAADAADTAHRTAEAAQGFADRASDRLRSILR